MSTDLSERDTNILLVGALRRGEENAYRMGHARQQALWFSFGGFLGVLAQGFEKAAPRKDDVMRETISAALNTPWSPDHARAQAFGSLLLPEARIHAALIQDLRTAENAVRVLAQYRKDPWLVSVSSHLSGMLRTMIRAADRTTARTIDAAVHATARGSRTIH